MTLRRLHGLYAITDSNLAKKDGLLSQVEAALIGGVRILQYRDKSDNHTRRVAEAAALLQLCKQYEIPLIINDDIQLAAEVGADGVHLGRNDEAIIEARTLLGSQAVIGISCYNDLERAQAAEQAGADYVAFGRFFSSVTKPDAIKADIDLLVSARQKISLPLVAIGGITPENGSQLIEAGADMLAVIQSIFAQPNICNATEHLQQLF